MIVIICDCLCENPPCLNVNFGLFFKVGKPITVTDQWNVINFCSLNLNDLATF